VMQTADEAAGRRKKRAPCHIVNSSNGGSSRAAD
jgi:hypothetical protein